MDKHLQKTSASSSMYSFCEQSCNNSIMTEQRALMRKNKTHRVKHDMKTGNRSPYLVSTFGIYYLIFLSLVLVKIFFYFECFLSKTEDNRFIFKKHFQHLGIK